MVNISSVKAQLARAGFTVSVWGRAEVKELCNILTDDEKIIHASNGYYEGGFALLVATDQRLLLIDRKPMFLTLDVISYGMIQEISLNYRLLNSTVNIYTSNKVLIFNSWHHAHLRAILMHVQQKVFESRQSFRGGQYPQASFSTQPTVPTHLQIPNGQNYNFNPQVNYEEPSQPQLPQTEDFEPTPSHSVIHKPTILTESFKQPFLAKRQYARRLM